MTSEHLIAFNIALVAAFITPGPALLVAIRTTLSSGRGAGIAIGIGLASMASLWTLMALVGLHVVFEVFPWAYWAAKTMGACYLLFIAYKTWKSARDKVDAQALYSARAFRQGFVINLLNPKSVLFAAALLIVVFPTDMSATENAIVVLNHFVIEVVFYTVIAFGMNSNAIKDRYLGAKLYLDRISAVILGSMGCTFAC